MCKPDIKDLRYMPNAQRFASYRSRTNVDQWSVIFREYNISINIQDSSTLTAILIWLRICGIASRHCPLIVCEIVPTTAVQLKTDSWLVRNCNTWVTDLYIDKVPIIHVISEVTISLIISLLLEIDTSKVTQQPNVYDMYNYILRSFVLLIFCVQPPWHESTTEKYVNVS